ncbi:cytochrome c oxidase subunit 3 [Halomonas koreensis]|uniref:Cytochrome c oxidase subunit 3 n=1 Tax=Halomonas koreensis TaxID=245385 RepID=A0ABU1G2S5_9GAMM|nr:cytochrome c oxidase subunit 3 [Halomonas koreensis]MDR5866828.1 cytochrome c oxidase subunit 3 [Halomonas koreensis]
MSNDRALPNPGWGPLAALPGNPLMWVLILSELLVFAAFFALYAWQRAADPALFDAAQRQLDPLTGGLNTLVLLTSGLAAALAVEAIAAGRRRRARRWLGAALGLGAVFCAVKGVEYADKLGAGLTPETNLFFGFYYGLTAFHFAHVLFGMALLALVTWRLSTANVETAAAFWHLVDLIWVLLYPLLYLLR